MNGPYLVNRLPRADGLILTIGFHTATEAPIHGTSETEWAEKVLATATDLDKIDPNTSLSAPKSGFLALLARTATDLRRAVSLASILPDAQQVIIALAEATSVRLPAPIFPSDIRQVQTINVRRIEDGWLVDVTFSRAMPAGSVLLAVARPLVHTARLPVQCVALAGPGSAHWRPGDPLAIASSLEGPLEGIRVPSADVVVRTLPATRPPKWLDDRVVLIDRPGPELSTWEGLARTRHDDQLRRFVDLTRDIDQVPPVDEFTVNPKGFIVDGTAGMVELRQTGECWTAFTADGPLLRVPPSGALADADIAKLRPFRGVRVTFGRHSGPIAAVRAIASLACAGVPVIADEVPTWAAALGRELIGLITTTTQADLDDDLAREVHSIRLRRAGMRTHSSHARWTSLGRAAGLPAPRTDVSVVMCTMRPDFVPRALAQVARQRHPDLEVILVLHGVPADQADVRAAVSTFPRPISVVEVDPTVPFGAALNRGAEVASGSLVSKWDDDDWYGPEHIADLVLAKHYSGADLVGAAVALVYLERINLTIHKRSHSEIYLRHFSGGTMLIDRHTLHELGGLRAQPVGEDTALRRAVAAAGGTTYTTHGLGFVVNRRTQGHTWDVNIDHFLGDADRQWRGLNLGPLIASDDAGTGESTMDLDAILGGAR